MSLERINAFFRRVGEWQLSRRFPILAALAIVTALSLAGVPRLVTSTGAEDWFDDSDTIKRDTDRFQELFGNDESVAILVKADDVFTQEVLEAIKAVGEEMLEEIPYANKITSLASLEISVGTEDGMEIVNPFGNGIPDSQAELDTARALILSRDTLRNRIVSEDCTETWISLSLHAYPSGDELKQGEREPLYVVGDAARKILEDPKWKSDAYEFLPVGTPYTESEELETVNGETSKRVIAGFAVMILCLALFIRSFRGLLVPVVTIGCGIGGIFGIMGWTGIKADASMMSLPILLGMALAVGYSIHLIEAIKRRLKITGNRRESVLEAVSTTGWPIFFTAITTIAGLISFLFANIGPLRWLGLACSSIVLAVYVYVFTLVPILMSFGRDRRGSLTENLQKDRSQEGSAAFYRLGAMLLRFRWPLAAAGALLLASFVPGIFRIEVNMEYFEMMGRKIPYVQRLDRIINSQLGSYLDYNVMISFPDPDAVKDPVVMKKFDEFMTAVGTLDMTKRVGGITPKIASILDIVKEMNKTLHGDDPEFYAIPEDPDLLAQTLFLYEISGGTALSEWVSEDYARIRAKIDLMGYNANGVSGDIAKIKSLGGELFPGAEIAIVGSAASYAEMNRKIVTGQLKSFAAAFAIICALMIAVFGSLKTGLIAMIPNLAPVIVIGGIMGYARWHMDMLTMTVMPMILGIAVDDTIHFVTHIKAQFERSLDYRDAVLVSFRSIGSTMLKTTTILCGVFFMYTFSPMNTLVKIGMLANIGLISALIADYTLTPVLIYLTKPFGAGRLGRKDDETEVA